MFNNETIKKIKVTAKIKVLFISDSWDILDIYENETYEAVTDSFYVEVIFLFFYVSLSINFSTFIFRQNLTSSVKRQMM